MRWVRRAFVALTFAALAATGAGCSGGRRPLLDRPQYIGPAALLLTPEIHVGGSGSPEQLNLAEVVQEQLRSALARQDIATIQEASAPGSAALRAALLEAWRTGRSEGLGRLRAGTDLGLGQLLEPAVRAGAETVVFAVLARSGPEENPDVYLPRPMDEVLERPGEQRPRDLPQAPGTTAAGGVNLDLLVVDVASGRVVTQRRTSYPVTSPPEIADAAPVLVREAVRGLRRPAQ